MFYSNLTELYTANAFKSQKYSTIEDSNPSQAQWDISNVQIKIFHLKLLQ